MSTTLARLPSEHEAITPARIHEIVDTAQPIDLPVSLTGVALIFERGQTPVSPPYFVYEKRQGVGANFCGREEWRTAGWHTYARREETDSLSIFIADTGKNRIVEMDYGLADASSFRKELTGLNGPWGVAGDESQYIYVTEPPAHRLRKYYVGESAFSLVAQFGDGNALYSVSHLNQPRGVAVDASGGSFVFVADAFNNRIVKLTRDLRFVAAVGGPGSGTGNNQFYAPSDVAVGGAHLFVADTLNNRIHKRRADDLSFVGAWGSYGGTDTMFYWPGGIAVCRRSGLLYVCDTFNNRVVLYDWRETAPIYLAKTGTGAVGSPECADAFGDVVMAAVRGDNRGYLLYEGSVAMYGVLSKPGFSAPRGIAGMRRHEPVARGTPVWLSGAEDLRALSTSMPLNVGPTFRRQLNFPRWPIAILNETAATPGELYRVTLRGLTYGLVQGPGIPGNPLLLSATLPGSFHVVDQVLRAVACSAHTVGNGHLCGQLLAPVGAAPQVAPIEFWPYAQVKVALDGWKVGAQ